MTGKNEKVRLQKLIAESGLCSRRKAEEFIKAGMVKVGGRTATVGDTADPVNDIITVSGKRIVRSSVKKYIKMYKPRGYTVSMSDEHNKKLASDLLNVKAGDRNLGETLRLFPVGRLDKNSEGLLLFTNDGDFANRVTHPKNEVTKYYRVTVPSKVSEENIAAMESGVDIGDGVKTAPCRIDVVDAVSEGDKKQEYRTVLNFAISEGKNRQIRRVCEAVGLSVSRLKRYAIGTSSGIIKLGMLKVGEYAELTEKELRIFGKK